MQTQNENFVADRYTVTYTGKWKNIKCMVEEDPEDHKPEEEDPAFNEIKDSLLNSLRQKFMGVLGAAEDSEEEDEEAEDDEESEEDEEENDSECEIVDEDGSEENLEDAEPPLIEEGNFICLTEKTDPKKQVGILLMHEGVAMGDVKEYDEKEPRVQFQHFGFQAKDPVLELPGKAKIGIFSKGKLQNIITCDEKTRLYHKFGERIILMEKDQAIVFNNHPIFFEQKNKFIKDYFDATEMKSIKEHKFMLMIKTF